jgi:hypothetical protein
MSKRGEPSRSDPAGPGWAGQSTLATILSLLQAVQAKRHVGSPFYGLYFSCGSKNICKQLLFIHNFYIESTTEFKFFYTLIQNRCWFWTDPGDWAHCTPGPRWHYRRGEIVGAVSTEEHQSWGPADNLGPPPSQGTEAGVLVRKLSQLTPRSAKLSGLTPGISYCSVGSSVS